MKKTFSQKTLITKEYPQKYKKGLIPYYPINDEKNQKIYKLYYKRTKSLDNFIFGGRLDEYKYMDMYVVIESVLNKFKFSKTE